MRQARRSPTLWLAGIILAGLAIWLGFTMVRRGRPVVTSLFPEPDSIAVPASAPLRIAFDRPMSRAGTEAALQSDPSMRGSFEWSGNSMVFTPEFPWPRGRTITLTLSTGARASGGIPLAEAVTWSFKTAPTLLAYLWPADEPADLYALDPLSGESVRFTETAYGVLDFSPAPDGLSLLLSLANAGSGSDIAVFDLLDRTLAVLHDCLGALCRNPQYSPDGAWIAFEETAAQQVFLLDGGSGAQESLGNGRFPTWSAEGLLLYYDPLELRYISLNPGTHTTSIYPNDDGEPPTWHPSGGAFMAADIIEIGRDALTSHLLVYLTFGDRGEDLSIDPNADDNAPVFSPDGRLVAFARRFLDPQRWTPGRQLWLMSADGKEARQLSDSPLYNHTAFAWSPDGAQIAYLRSNQADLNEPPEIWLLDVEEGSRLRILINGYSPQWLP